MEKDHGRRKSGEGSLLRDTGVARGEKYFLSYEGRAMKGEI